MKTTFKIHRTMQMGDKVQIVTELVNKGGQFDLSDNSFLGGIPIENWLDMPRMVDEQGNQRFDWFVFKLKDKNDIHKLKEQDIVELDTI
jgi:hypothetical protein